MIRPAAARALAADLYRKVLPLSPMLIDLAASLIIAAVQADEDAAALEISQLRNPKALLRMS